MGLVSAARALDLTSIATSPSPRDVNSLAQFSDRLNRQVRRYLFYLGDEYRAIEDVQLLPVAALFRGK